MRRNVAMLDAQKELFGVTVQLPEGMRYEEDFLSPEEETTLLSRMPELPLRHAEYKQFTARRRVASYGGRFDYTSNELLPAAPIPEWLTPLRDRAAEWAALPAEEIEHALVAEYAPGTPLGWHRDVPDFEAIIGVSLGGGCRMRLRRYPPQKPGRAELALDLAPRSIYTIQGPARWCWQHAVSPTKVMRYSITFRTTRKRR